MKSSSSRSAVHTLRIAELAAKGSGIAKLEDGRVVFVPGACTGDLIRASVDSSKKPAQGSILSLLEPSPLRKEPECPYVQRCGGCDWMHIRPEAQEEAHRHIVQSALFHACGNKQTLPEIRIHRAPRPLGYRTRARLFASAGRASRPKGSRGPQLGYRVQGSHELVPIEHCAVLDPALAALLPALPSVLEGADGQGELGLALGAGQKPAIEMQWEGSLPAAFWARIDKLVANREWAGARIWLGDVKIPACFGDPRALCQGADGLPLWIAAGGFAQSSDEGATLLAQCVNELACKSPRSEVKPDEPAGLHTVELFSGSGTLSVLLARRAASFAGVELDAEAAACARENFAARNLSGKHVAADANAFEIPPRTELVVLDPPRTGAPGAVKHIAASQARVVVYVACDPATLARDMALLTGSGFTVTHIETLELFPQTSHVETVVRLAKGRRAKASP